MTTVRADFRESVRLGEQIDLADRIGTLARLEQRIVHPGELGAARVHVLVTIEGCPMRDRIERECGADVVGAGAPRPVGLLNPARPVAFRLAPGAAVEGTSFAVSIEPEGGSPTGQPTGPIPYSGSALRIAQPS